MPFEYSVLIFIGGLVANVGTILLAAATLIFLRTKRVPARKAFSYSCFFLGGAIVAKLQWVIIIAENSPSLDLEIYATAMLVGTFSFIGLLASFKFLRGEKPLITIIVLTIGLAALQYYGGPEQLLNWYARFYAVICLAGPIVVLIQTKSRSRTPRASE